MCIHIYIYIYPRSVRFPTIYLPHPPPISGQLWRRRRLVAAPEAGAGKDGVGAGSRSRLTSLALLFYFAYLYSAYLFVCLPRPRDPGVGPCAREASRDTPPLRSDI